jgi:hypothetical protein
MRNIMLAVLASVLAVMPISAAEHDTYRYVISMDRWPEEGESFDGEIEVRLNGKLLGPILTATPKLDSLPIERGDRVKLELPLPKARNLAAPHSSCLFVQRFVERGAVFDWYEGGKRMTLHTVTWTDLTSDGNFKTVMDDFTYVVDGVRIGKGEALTKLISRWRKRPDLVIQLVYPKETKHEAYNPQPGVGINTLRDSKRSEGLRVYSIIPYDWTTMEHGESDQGRVEGSGEGQEKNLQSAAWHQQALRMFAAVPMCS